MQEKSVIIQALTSGFRYDISDHRRVPVKPFRRQDRRIWASEEGYWQDFLN
jgi:hypothetical protein